MQGKGSLDNYRVLQQSRLPSVPDSHSNKTTSFLGDIFNFIRQISMEKHKEGDDSWQMS